MITPTYVLRRLREQLRYLRALHELTRIDRDTLDDIGIAPEQLPAPARRQRAAATCRGSAPAARRAAAPIAAGWPGHRAGS